MLVNTMVTLFPITRIHTAYMNELECHENVSLESRIQLCVSSDEWLLVRCTGRAGGRCSGMLTKG